MSAIEQYDQVGHFWCPLLGQPLNFGYCRRYQDGLPCHRVIACYEPHFDVAAFIKKHYSPEEQERFLGQPQSRMETVSRALAQSKKGEE